jgi:hypothetical protein
MQARNKEGARAERTQCSVCALDDAIYSKMNPAVDRSGDIECNGCLGLHWNDILNAPVSVIPLSIS